MKSIENGSRYYYWISDLFWAIQWNRQQWYDRKDVLQRVDHLRQGQDAEAERGVVMALDDDLSLQQDECQNL